MSFSLLRRMQGLSLACGLAQWLAPLPGHAAELAEPPVFTSNSRTHVLDLLMVARQTQVPALHNLKGWVYEICERRFSRNDNCLPGHANPHPYGGARLQLNPGDTLLVHLVNRLPVTSDADNALLPGEQFLAQNPTNIHTHGMLVPPTQPAANAMDPSYGDNVFVLTFNPQNGAPNITADSHLHGDVRETFTDYRITLPAHHPAGLYWFHPHAHGISLNQVSAGMSGIISVGQVGDYLQGLPAHTSVRHLILKDTQVNADHSLKDEEDPDLCQTATSQPGFCQNAGGDRWYFSVNGQLDPHIGVHAAGEVWRITNASGSASYSLQLGKKHGNQVDGNGMLLQVLSIDGISITPASSAAATAANQAGGRFRPEPCPGVSASDPAAVCTRQLLMMPASRAEIWVVNRNADGSIGSGDGNRAVLQTAGLNTGPAGDSWPAMDLAQVSFQPGNPRHPAALTVSDNQQDAAGLLYHEIAHDLAASNASVPADSSCQALPAGWKRRVYFGYPTPDNFGLGMVLIDADGNEVADSFQDVAAFTGMNAAVCVPLGSGNTPVRERWEIVNLTGEDHNFHIHQTKFRVLAKWSSGTSAGILQDGVRVPAGADGCDGTVATWKSGGCATTPVKVEIPFAITGDFVYHCHILEHEDGGMMAKIHVASGPKAAKGDDGWW